MVPAEATEVCIAYVDGLSYDMTEPAAAKAAKLWSLGYGSWRTTTTTEPFESGLFYSNNYEDGVAPDLYVAASWKDAEGNYYYTEVHFQDKMQYYHDKMYAMIYGEQTEPEVELTIVGKQWDFNWTEMAASMGVENMPSVFDFGVSIASDYFLCGIDYEALYGAEAAGMWMAYFEGNFVVEPTDATSGVIYLVAPDPVTGEAVSQAAMEYFDLTETTCTFNAPDFMLNNVQATLRTETVSVMSQGIAM